MTDNGFALIGRGFDIKRTVFRCELGIRGDDPDRKSRYMAT